MLYFCFYHLHLRYIIDIYYYPSQKIEIKDNISSNTYIKLI